MPGSGSLPVLSLALSLALGACAGPPTATGPNVPSSTVPAQWRHVPAEPAAAALDAAWWHSLGNAELAALVEAARTASFDVGAAEARVRQAQASARVAGAALWPEVTANLQSSHVGLLDGGSRADAAQTSSHTLGLSAAYEVDLWGRMRAVDDSAAATLRASLFDRDAVRLAVSASVATAWLQAVGLRERLAIADRNVADAQRLLQLVESRVRAGAAQPFELAQQRGIAATQRRVRAEIAQQAEDRRTALAVLLGRGAADLPIATQTLADVQPPAVGAGQPADLLARRPDIARAEAQLAAAQADVAAARAAMLPSLQLTAGVATGGSRLRALLDHPLYAIGADLLAPIFDAGRRAAGRDLAAARQQELLADYGRAITVALGEVETALNAGSAIDLQRAEQAEELAQARRAVVLAEARYRAGAETLLVLLDAQRSLYAAQDAAVQWHAARLQASVDLYRALGGGWARPL